MSPAAQKPDEGDTTSPGPHYPPGLPAVPQGSVPSTASSSDVPSVTSSPSPAAHSSSSGLPQTDIYVIVVIACLILIPVCIGVGAWLYRARSRKAAVRAASGNTPGSRNTIETRATSPTASTAGLISPDDSVLHEPTAFYASRMVRSRDSQVGHPSAEAV